MTWKECWEKWIKDHPEDDNYRVMNLSYFFYREGMMQMHEAMKGAINK